MNKRALLRGSVEGMRVSLCLLTACSGNHSSSGPGGSGGTLAISAGATGTGGTVSSGGIVSSAGGAMSGGGQAGSGGSTALGGSTSVQTASGGSISMGGSTGSGGLISSTGGSATGGPAMGGLASGGSVAGGTLGNGGIAEPGSGGVAASGDNDGGSGDCPRDLLKSMVAAYFTALATHSASTLPLDTNVKFTENGKVLQVGTDGLWKTAGTLKYAQSALDADGCNTASEAVVPDGTMDIPFALRLKLQNQKITEIETIAVRPGDYKVSGSNFPSDTNAIIQSATTVKWEDAIPDAQRNTREEITAWMDKYFKVFPAGVCNTDSNCKRLENGGGSFSCSAGASCQSGAPTGTPVIKSHIIFADVETGIGVGFDLFMGNTDMHMFKMYGGKVYAVHAILGAATSTGWD